MTRNQIYILIAVVIIVVGFFIFRGTSSPDVGTPKNATILAFGDSLVQGVGATQGNDFVSVTGRLIGMPIINAGRSGDTTAAALSRIDESLAQNPGVVIVLLGGNDFLRRVPKTTTFNNLAQIVTRFKDKGAIVVLLGVRGGLITDTYESDFKDFAQQNNLPYISNVLDGLLGDKQYMYDQIHPNDAGYKIIAERVAPVLKGIYKK